MTSEEVARVLAVALWGEDVRVWATTPKTSLRSVAKVTREPSVVLISASGVTRSEALAELAAKLRILTLVRRNEAEEEARESQEKADAHAANADAARAFSARLASALAGVTS